MISYIAIDISGHETPPMTLEAINYLLSIDQLTERCLVRPAAGGRWFPLGSIALAVPEPLVETKPFQPILESMPRVEQRAPVLSQNERPPIESDPFVSRVCARCGVDVWPGELACVSCGAVHPVV